ncbi:MAG: cation:proton antiporter [Gammaproteobacteria bacterium]|nr:cation:proton antiporter [Gammaproteobacteria bacterium]
MRRNALLVGYADPARASLLLVGIVASRLSSRLGLPLRRRRSWASACSPGRTASALVHHFQRAFLLSQLALAVILLDGGLRTELDRVRIVLAPAAVLATAGVVITAALTAAFAVLLLGLDWPVALLIGAIVSSTDAAAVFGLLGQARLNQRVSGTLELESGATNSWRSSWWSRRWAWSPARGSPRCPGWPGPWLCSGSVPWVVSSAAGSWRCWPGCDGGRALCPAGRLRRSDPVRPDQPARRSGSRSTWRRAAVVGNRRSDATDHVFRDGTASPAGPGEHVPGPRPAGDPVADGRAPAGAIAVAIFLILVARPVAIWLGLAPFRYPLREIAFISWVGLRGAVPIVLALFPLLAGVEGGRVIFDLVFAVVLISLLVQGTTLQPMARLLRVEGPHRDRALDRVALQMPMDEEMELAQFAAPTP